MSSTNAANSGARSGHFSSWALAFGCSLAIYALAFRLPALGKLASLAATVFGTVPMLLLYRSLQPSGAPFSARERWLLLLSTVALRLSIPLPDLSGSDDAYRYIWDGRIQAAGINPFRFAPQSSVLSSYRDAVFYPQIFRPDMRTVYPPLAQIWFLLAYAVGGMSVVGLKLLFALNDVVSVWLLVRLLQKRGLSPLRALIYAWSPLAIVQGYAGAHLDILIVPWLLLAVLWADERPLASGAALACATMVRPVAILCGPALGLRRPFLQTLLFGVGFLFAAVLLIAPYSTAGFAPMVESLRTYGTHWLFNGSFFQLLYFGAFREWAPLRPVVYGTIALGALLLGVIPFARDRDVVDRDARAGLSYALYFALAPTVYPWYLVPLHALLARFSGPLAFALPALVTLSDLVHVDGQVGGKWQVPLPALIIEYTAIYGLLIWMMVRKRSGLPNEAANT
jgi:alpha-1,6-mannosyltransferase